MKTNLKYGQLLAFCFGHTMLNALGAITLIGIYFTMPYTVKKFAELFAASLSKE